VAQAWTEAELEAAVAAYFEMLDHEAAGQPYSKAEINRTLRDGPLEGRSKGSVEFKFGNISAVLRKAGLPWVAGYKPYPNVQKALREKVLTVSAGRGLLDASDFNPTADPDEFQRRTQKVRSRGIAEKPTGSPQPEKIKVGGREVTKRDPAVAAWVLEQAAGTCELCGQPAPFEDSHGEPFLEVHHVRWLSEGGPDTPENAAAVCPNCHRLLHHGAERDVAKGKLYGQVGRLNNI